MLLSQHDPRVTVGQMLDHISEALAFVSGKQRSDLEEDRKLELALIRLVEVVGEAASRLPPGFREKHPAVPWKDAVGMRNRLIHAYDTFDKDILWTAVHKEFPRIKVQLERILSAT